MTRPLEDNRFEHSRDLREAHKDMTDLRKRIKRLLWVSAGKGYDGMGQRELENARDRLDEAAHWLNAAGGSLSAGGKRAVAEGFPPRPPKEKKAS